MKVKVRQSPVSRLLLACASFIVIGLVPAAPGHAWLFSAPPEQEAFKKSREDFKTVQEAAEKVSEQTAAALEGALEVEKQLSDEIRKTRKAGKQIPASLADAAAKARTYRETIEQTSDVAEKFSDYASKATTAMDVVSDIMDIHEQMQKNQQAFGQLGGALGALAKGMDKYGGKVPILGDAIQLYGGTTTKMLDKVREVATSIEENRHQGTLSPDAATWAISEKSKLFKAFRDEHPKELHGPGYVPSTPPYLYVNMESEAQGFSALWDEEVKEFTLVPQGNPVKDIYAMHLLLEKDDPLKAGELKTLMGQWKNEGEPRLKAARKLQAALARMNKDINFTDVVGQVGRQGYENVFSLVRNPRVFEARYVYDVETRERAHHTLKALHDELIADGREVCLNKAAGIRNFARKELGFVIAAPAPPPKPENKAARKDKPSAAEGIFKAFSDGLDKLNKDLEKLGSTTSSPQKAATPPPPAEVKKVEAKPAPPPPPAVKAGSTVGSCGECRDNGLDCACGRAACRCCAPGDSGCNAFDL